jgi:tryptophanyl-tRNA synthetase
LVKIPGLDGKGKMGKSEGENNAVYLADDEETIRKKVMRAVTDSGPMAENQEKPEVIQNLFDILKVVSTADTYQHFDEAYAKAQIRYGDFKKQLAEDIILATATMRNRINDLAKDTSYLQKVANLGTEKARESAGKTIKEVRELIGFRKF